MNLALYMFAALLIAFPLAAAVALTGISEYYPSERATLLQLRDSLNSTANLHSNWTGSPCINNQSKWDGIDCWNGYVVGIVLDEIQLTGSLPPDFPQNITFLTKLSLRKNFLFGPLPNLTNLLYLNFVLLSENYLIGQIPSDCIQLPNLMQLELQQNQLSGEIPPFDQQTLIGFNVSYNHLHSQIPETNILQGFPDSSYLRNPGLCGRPSKEKCPSPPPPPTVQRPKQAKQESQNVGFGSDLPLPLAWFHSLSFLLSCVIIRECPGKKHQKRIFAGASHREEKASILDNRGS
ncbi:hypothetical protein SLE2022_347630 [Rubroshorea leprosula]